MSIHRADCDGINIMDELQRNLDRDFIARLMNRGTGLQDLDRVAVRAALWVSQGQLDRRDFRQLLPQPPIKQALWLAGGDLAGAHGNVIAGYKIDRLLRLRESSAIFLARHPRLGHRVVLKLVNDAESAQRERQALQAITHPNVVRLWDVGTLAGREFLVLEYLPGGSLADRLLRHGTIPARRVVKIARQVAQGLRASQKAGFYHHDIKPGNLLQTGKSAYKVADFGSSERVEQTSAVDSETIRGSWRYMAPERFSGPGDHRSDIYSLGLTLVHLLTGNAPIQAWNRRDAMQEHHRLKLEPLHWTVPGVNRKFSQVITKMTARDPDARPQDYTHLLLEMDRGLTDDSDHG